MAGKDALATKTLWFNVIVATLQVLQVVPIPPQFGIPILAVGNILLRIFFTEQPVVTVASIPIPKSNVTV